MRELTGSGEHVLGKDDHLLKPLLRHAAEHPGRAMLAHRVGSQFVDVTATQFLDKVKGIASGLIGLGLAPGSRVAVMAKTSMEWTWLDYGILAAGCVVVPIYETSSAEQVEWIVGNSESKALFVENSALKGVYDEVASKLTTCKDVFVIEEGGIDQIIAKGEGVDRAKVDERINALTTEDTATLVYTSGTTGMPKGCVLTHGNLRWDAIQVVNRAKAMFAPTESTLLFLPLAHIFGRVIQFGAIESGAKLGYVSNIKNLLEELGIFQPTFVLSVPRVFEKVYNGAQLKASADGKAGAFAKGVEAAIAWSEGEAKGRIPLGVKLKHAIFDRLMYHKVRHLFGGRVRYAISGGAPLGARLGHFFNGIGVTVLEGYGLTETSAGATLNFPDAYRIGTVGKPLPGGSIKIADDGEILIKGPHVFQGYYKNEAATKEALEADGWFHSGDIGELDGDGFLTITGRKKDLIVTAGGKNVAPAVLEDRLRADKIVSQVVVVGDNKPFIAALVTVDPEFFPAWAQMHGKTGKSIADLVDDAELRADVQAAVDDANKAVSKAESIRTFAILPEDFTIESGELTPTLKVKRNVVIGKYGKEIEALYAGQKAD